MAFCATCGSAVEGQFCSKCGSRAGAAPSASSGPAMPAAETMADNVASTLCYLAGFVSGIIFLVLDPYRRNPAIRFHAFQSIFLSVACIVVWIGLSIFNILLQTLIRVVGMYFLDGLLGLAFLVLWLAIFALWIYMLIQTYQGKTIMLPVIGPLAKKQAGN